jgi:hypothetical protein
MGMFPRSRNPIVIDKMFYLYRVTLKLKVMNLYMAVEPLHDMTSTFKVMEWLHSLYSLIFELLYPNNIDINTKITLLACF